MGSVIRFPDSRPPGRSGDDAWHGSATVVILPVVRIERHGDAPDEVEKPGSRRKRRRRASRS